MKKRVLFIWNLDTDIDPHIDISLYLQNPKI